MIFLLIAQMGIFIHPKSLRVNQIFFVAGRKIVGPIRAEVQWNPSLHRNSGASNSSATRVH
jgi:hypothetical protein